MHRTKTGITPLLLAAALMLLPATAGAISLDNVLKAADKAVTSAKSGTSSSSSSSSTSSLSDSEVTTALKEALSKAVDSSVSQLGTEGGFLNDADVRIPLPGSLSKLETLAKAAGKTELVDNFVASMNHAAEEAVPETVEIFGKALKAMTLDDAKGILNGGDDAATSYFKKNSSTELEERIKPLVSTAMDNAGVTKRYKELTSGVSSAGAAFGADWLDLDSYVTEKAVDGLFTVMAEQEAQIRSNPTEWTTSVLKKVFGSLN